MAKGAVLVQCCRAPVMNVQHVFEAEIGREANSLRPTKSGISREANPLVVLGVVGVRSGVVKGIHG